MCAFLLIMNDDALASFALRGPAVARGNSNPIVAVGYTLLFIRIEADEMI